ncbi:MAG: hypothetical protein WD906_03330 [Anaerolineales bacterium]
MSRKGIVGFGVMVLIVASACGILSSGATPEGGGPETGRATPEPEAQENSGADMVPVSINQGLASLDSYSMTFTTDMLDSVAQERTVTTLVVSNNRDADASYNRTETRVETGDGELLSEEVQEQYIIGNQSCTVAEGEAEVTSMSDMAQVMAELMSQVVDFNPLIENPVHVGQEDVNGVSADTYTFEVRSLGAASDAEATRADGSYAIAVDGDFLVRYRLDLELRSGPEGDPEAEYSISSYDLSLGEINQPVEIAFPPECQAAASGGG